MNYARFVATHTTLMLNIDDPTSQWHVVRWPPNSTKTMLDNASHYRDFVQCQNENWKHNTFASTYKEMKNFPSTNNVQDEFRVCYDNMRSCMNGNTNGYVMD